MKIKRNEFRAAAIETVREHVNKLAEDALRNGESNIIPDMTMGETASGMILMAKLEKKLFDEKEGNADDENDNP